MKRAMPLLFIISCVSMAHAGYADGLISAGEYEELVDWISGTLIVDGGGRTPSWHGTRAVLRCGQRRRSSGSRTRAG